MIKLARIARVLLNADLFSFLCLNIMGSKSGLWILEFHGLVNSLIPVSVPHFWASLELTVMSNGTLYWTAETDGFRNRMRICPVGMSKGKVNSTLLKKQKSVSRSWNKTFQISLLFDIGAVATFDFSDLEVFIQLPFRNSSICKQ